MTERRSGGVALLVLAVLVAAGLALRLHDLEARAMGHTESYVPGIVLPDDFGEPRARLTLDRAVVNSMWEVHPPGWYALMWFWTKAFGTSLLAIRLPGVLLSTACIALVFLLARLEGDRRAAFVAAALVAFSGHQIYWSQVARPAAMLCFLALAASVLLLRVSSGGKRRPALLLYGTTLTLGLVIEYYFWIFAATHVLWNLVENRRAPRTAVAVLRTQLLAVVLASPIVTLAVFQSRAAHFEGDLIEGVRDLLQLGFLFVETNPVPYAVPRWAPLVLPVVGAVLFAAGLFAVRGRTRERQPEEMQGPNLGWLAGAGVVMTGVVLAAARFYAGYAPAKAGTLSATAVFPALLVLVAALARRPDSVLVRIWTRLLDTLHRGSASLSLAATLAVVPTVVVAAATAFTPLFAERQMILFVPFLLIVLARGVAWLANRRNRAAAVVVALVLTLGLGAAHAASLRWYAGRVQSPHDYRGLAERWKPALQDGDLVFVIDHWCTTPIFYYVELGRYRFVPRNWEAVAAKEPRARVWRLAFDGFPVPEEMQRALLGHRRIESLKAEGVTAELYVPLR
ncbi:MAG: glycosyltransferase family 39 protein [Candidatus Eiseniibacteriota bacterium]